MTFRNKHSSSNFTEYIGDISVAKSKPSTVFTQSIELDIRSKPSLGNMTEYIGDVSARDDEMRDEVVRTSASVSRAESTNIEPSEKQTNERGNWLRGLTKSFEEEGIFGLSFGIVNAVTSKALHVVTGTASNVGNLLTQHHHYHDNERQLTHDKRASSERKEGPAVLQFASYIADIVLSTVSPVLDLHFFGYAPSPMNDVQLSVYWDSPSIKKSIGYDHEACSFMGTESVYFDTRSVGFFSAMTGDERSVAESLRTEDDFFSAVSREEIDDMEIEFV
jgi:hypothetical protein